MAALWCHRECYMGIGLGCENFGSSLVLWETQLMCSCHLGATTCQA